jgi:hypothetical protein
MIGLNTFCFVQFLKPVDFAPKFCPLYFHSFNFMFDICELLAEITDLVTLHNSFIAQTARFKVLFIEQTLRSVHLITEVAVLFRLFL